MQGLKLVSKFFLVGLIICLTCSSLLKITYYSYAFTSNTGLNDSVESSTFSENPSKEDLSPDILDYAPYLQRFRGRTQINGIQTSKDNDRIYFGHSSYGIGCYFTENNSYKTLSFENPISEISQENSITDLELDENQSKLYIGAWAGLIIVDLTDWSYEMHNFSEGYFINEIRCLHHDEEDQFLFIGTDIGLRIFFTNNQTFLDTATLPYLLRSGPYGIDVADMDYDSKTKALYIAHYDTLSVYNVSTNILNTIYLPPDGLYSLALDPANNRIFLGSNGLIIFNLTNKQVIAHYGAHPNPPYKYNIENLIFESQFGGMVFGSIDWDKGTYVVNTTAETITYLNKSTGLLHDFVSSFGTYIDNSTGMPMDYMLIACKGGFCYYDYSTSNITKALLVDEDIPSNSASHLSLNEELNQLYIGSGFTGWLSVLDLNTSTNIANYDYSTGLPDAFMGYAQYYSKNNTAFIGTGTGLVLFNLTSKETIRKFTPADGLLDYAIQDMLLTEELGLLFIATISGFNILNLATLEIESYFEGSYCYSLILDNKQEKLYVGVSDNVKILSLSSMLFTSISLPEDTLCCYDIELYEEENIAFIGTQNGLYILNLKTSIFIEHYTRQNSPLSNNLLYKGIHFDEETGNLFISNIDLTVFNYEHNFWFNLNDAYMVDEGLFEINTDSIAYSNKKLYLGTFSYGLFIIDHRDEDADELFDCYEVWLFGTNPAMNDTDLDGFTDAEELWAGTDPLDPNSYPIPPNPEPSNLRYLWFLTTLTIPITVIIFYLIRKKHRQL